MTCKSCLKEQRKARKKFIMAQKKKGRAQRIAEREAATTLMKNHFKAVMTQFVGIGHAAPEPKKDPLIFVPHYRGDDEIN